MQPLVPTEQKKKLGRPIEWTTERIHKFADDFLAFMEVPDNYWFKDFALENGHDPIILSELAEIDPYFSSVLSRARAIQESKLAKNGLKNKFNSQLTQFVLINAHNWRNKSEVDITSNGQQLGYIGLPNAKPIIQAEVIEVE